jgi:hypothetical protein
MVDTYRAALVQCMSYIDDQEYEKDQDFSNDPDCHRGILQQRLTPTTPSSKKTNSGSSLKDVVMPLRYSLPPVIPLPPADSTPKGIPVSSLDDWLSGSTPTSTPGMGNAS